MSPATRAPRHAGGPSMRSLGPLAAFIGCIIAANALTATLGVVTWLGIAATAGTWIAGLGFVARDYLHETAGHRWVLAAILAGAALSAALSPAIALASGVAFLLSETADWAIYTPLRQRGMICAAIASNTVGAVVDTAAFLLIAGLPMWMLGTQVLVKIVASTAVVLGVRLALPCQPMHAAGGVSDA